MADECLFCKIVRGGIPCYRVHEDGKVLAFLDVRPLSRGHTLVVPKTHAGRLEDLSARDAAALWEVTHRLLPALARATGAPASTVAVNNGREAGQEVGHVHIHVVPRSAGDGAGPIHALFAKRPTVSPEELAALAAKVRGAA